MDEVERAEMVARFWNKVPEQTRAADACWEWAGATSANGYGTFWDGSRQECAHRYAYSLAYGSVPEGQHVRHKCDNPACVRPTHLTAGTAYENVLDRDRRGRTARGSRHSRALPLEVCAAILRAEGPAHKVAKKYDVHPNTVSAIRRGRHWSADELGRDLRPRQPESDPAVLDVRPDLGEA